MFFLAAEQPSPALIRVKTPQGNPHFAFTSEELGNKYIEAKDLNNMLFLVKKGDIPNKMDYDFKYGVLVIDTENALENFLMDTEKFDYESHYVSQI